MNRKIFQLIPRAVFPQTFSRLLLEVQSDYADSIQTLTVNMVIHQDEMKQGTIELKGVNFKGKSGVMWVYAFSCKTSKLYKSTVSPRGAGKFNGY